MFLPPCTKLEAKMAELTHIDSKGQPTMVDVSNKDVTVRTATARTVVSMPLGTAFFKTGEELHTAKGPVLATAIVAGTLAVKQTSQLIPFCHPLAIEACTFQFEVLSERELIIDCQVKTRGVTGVEMEALTGVSVAALTVWDMCKALTPDLKIGPTELLSKTGGKRDVVAEHS